MLPIHASGEAAGPAVRWTVAALVGALAMRALPRLGSLVAGVPSATSRAVVVNDVADEFVERIAARASNMRIGAGNDPKTEMGPSVDENQFKTVLSYIDIGREDGATLVCGGSRATGNGLDRGYFVHPAVFDHVTPDMRIAREEIFGPVLSVLRVKDFDEAMQVANDCDYGLSSSIFTSDAPRIFRFVDEIETGMTHINSPTTGGEAHVPFGGIKGTGIGDREQGSTALPENRQCRRITRRATDCRV